MERIKVNLIVKGDLWCREHITCESGSHVVGVNRELPNEIPATFRFGGVEYDLSDASVLTGDIDAESLVVSHGLAVLATGLVLAHV